MTELTPIAARSARCPLAKRQVALLLDKPYVAQGAYLVLANAGFSRTAISSSG